MIIYGNQNDYPESEQFDEQEYEREQELQEDAEEDKRAYMKEISEWD